MFIIFEGIPGTGKTTQSKKLFNLLKKEFPKKEVVWTREPGGTEIAEGIRAVVQAIKFKEDMDPTCEAYLYAAARAQMLRKVAKVPLEKDGIVISDRSFITGLVYQGFVRGLGFEAVLKINEEAIKGFDPDIVFYLDMPIKMALSRTFDKDGDKWERLGPEFFERVIQGYKKVSNLPLFEGKWVNIDATGSQEDIFKLIREGLQKHIRLS